MRVRLRNPDREVQVAGPRKVRDVLSELGVDPDTVLVIRQRTLVTREERHSTRGRIIDGASVQEKVAKLVDALRNEAKVL